MIATKLTIECMIKDIRFASDPRSQFIDVVKKILDSVFDEALAESAAPEYLTAAYQELVITEFFRKEREEHG